MGIKQIIKNTYYNLNTVLKIWKYKTFLYKNNTKPKKLGDKIVILGNSPEANIYFENRDKFVEYDLLVVNDFPLDEQRFLEYRPRFLCMVHPGIFKEGKFLYNEENNRENLRKMWRILEQKVEWPLIIITYGGNELPIKNNNIKLVHMSPVHYNNESTDFQKWCFYNNICLSPSQNVTTVGIQFAEIYGYKEIALFGINLDWMKDLNVDEKNQLLFAYRHYYEEEQNNIVNDTYLNQIKATYNTFWGFEECNNLAAEKEIKIINYTPKSFLQCFKKIKIDSTKKITKG